MTPPKVYNGEERRFCGGLSDEEWAELEKTDPTKYALARHMQWAREETERRRLEERRLKHKFILAILAAVIPALLEIARVLTKGATP